MAALSGVSVIELTHYISGPVCGQVLADHGATVTKVEPPSGDPTRKAYPLEDGASAYFASVNRGKQSVFLDLKSKSGQSDLTELVKQADIVITNYSKTAALDLGLTFGELIAINPAIVFTQITGFGARPSDPDIPAFDGVIQSMSGLASLTGDPAGPPTKAGQYVADQVTAWIAATGTLLAYLEAKQTGEPRHVDISMLDAAFSMNHFYVPLVKDFSHDPTRSGNRSKNAVSSTFQAADGWVYIAPITDVMWSNLSNTIGHPEFGTKEHPYSVSANRLDDYDEIVDTITKWTSRNTTAHIIKTLQDLKVPCAPVSTVREAVESPLITSRNMITDSTVDGKTFSVSGNPIKIYTTESTK